MNFNEWCEKNMPPDTEELDKEYVRMGWDGAVDEVIKIIDVSGAGGDSDEYIKEIIMRLKTKSTTPRLKT